MKHEIKVPEVSEGVTEGTIVDIAVAVGDKVEVDQTLVEFETDKAVIAIPSPRDGDVAEIKVSVGDDVAVGAVIMLLESADSSSDDEKEQETTEQQEQADESEEEPDPEATKEPEQATAGDSQDQDQEQSKTEAKQNDEQEEEPEQDRQQEKSDAGEDQADQADLTTVRRDNQVAPAAPSVRRKARELGVDIYQVQGTGPGGRISETDVRQFVKATMQRISGAGGPVPGQQPKLPDFTRWGEVTTESLSRVREVTANVMAQAWSTVPMVTQYDHARISEVEDFRQEYNGRADQERRLTMTAILVKICAAALTEFPRFNSSLDLTNRELILKKFINIGVAVDTPAGLLVPVIKSADGKGLETLAAELNELAEKTRERKVGAEEMEGGSFTISNLGGIGGTAFTPIVYPPQVAILGVSTAETRPVWNGRDFSPALVMPLSLTYDHRVIDGADGARFLRWICKALEHPLQLVMKG